MVSRSLTRRAISPRPRTVVPLSRVFILAKIAPWRKCVLLKKRKARLSHPNDTALVHFLLRDPSAIIRILPNWKFGARCASSIHDFLVAPLDVREPPQEDRGSGLQLLSPPCHFLHI